MDHFNSTIRDGELVSTRRGLQVSRQKFNGISFVNAYPQSSGSTSGSGSGPTTSPDQSRPAQRQFKFVEAESSSGANTPRSQRHDSNSPTVSGLSAETCHTKKTRKRLSPRDQPSTTSPAPSSRRSSHASSNTSSVGEGLKNATSGTERVASQTPGASWWPSHEPPMKMSKDNWSLFHRYFATLPSKIYPFEDILAYNPATGSEFYEMHANDEVAVQIVLMCGSIATAIVDEEINPKGLAYYISIICAMLNRKLNQSKAVDHVTLLCIAALAASACYVGRLDHWHMHMRGLQKALDVNGGLSGLPAWLLNKIHLTDLEGSTALACGPYLEYTRTSEPVSNILAPALRNRICSSLSNLLGPLRIDSTVIDALSSLSLFSASVKLARSSSGAVTLEPHAFTAEWLAVKHLLVTQPRPLRDQMAATAKPSLFNPFKVPGTDTPTTSNAIIAGEGDLYIGSHRLQPGVPVIPAELGPGGPLEPALRIACLLYQKELLPNWPRNLGGYAVLLKLLNEHMRSLETILADSGGIGYHQSRAQKIPNTRGKRSGKGAIGKNSSRDNSSASPSSTYPEAAAPSTPASASLKPVLLWLCVVSDMISRIADQNECRRRRQNRDDQDTKENDDDDDDDDDDADKCYPRAIYRDIFQEIVGIRTEQHVDEVLANEEEDLAMFDLLDPGLIYRESPLILKAEHAVLVSRKGGGGGGQAAEDGSGLFWLKKEQPPHEDHHQQYQLPPRHDSRSEGSGDSRGGVWDLRHALMGMLYDGEGG
ncbi:hypothetical protein QBC37DRAFT_370737 [Rhypophila decipiens]|uniref:Uncharacterized protein n=1 Tax=Rhypophila decipiens TaxID=261697 RepID=A0AAN7BD64_9PEZI|nr:hypothetical protein QBC37DRAFT_370737 [Rhypophila decipiens]